MNTNVSAVAGDTAHLPCRVKDLGEYTVKFVWYIYTRWHGEKGLIRKSWFLTLGIYFLGFLATRPWYKCFICWSRHIQLRSTFPSNWRNKRSYFFFWLEFRGKKSRWINDIQNDYMKLPFVVVFSNNILFSLNMSLLKTWWNAIFKYCYFLNPVLRRQFDSCTSKLLT